MFHSKPVRSSHRQTISMDSINLWEIYSEIHNFCNYLNFVAHQVRWAIQSPWIILVF